MRGCLVTLALLVTIAIAATWLALPPLAGTLTQGALVAAGFKADAMTVTVSADPPPRLLSLRADEVHVQATNATYHGLQAVDVDLTLHDVRLADRTFGALEGTLHHVTSAGGLAGGVTIPLAVLTGTRDRVRVTMTFPISDAEDLAVEAVRRAIGIAPTRVTLAAPDRVRIEAGGLTIGARLAINGEGALMLIPPEGATLGVLALVQPGPDGPFRLDSFRLAADELVVVATLDPSFG
jgi:hypothetical protein